MGDVKSPCRLLKHVNIIALFFEERVAPYLHTIRNPYFAIRNQYWCRHVEYKWQLPVPVPSRLFIVPVDGSGRSKIRVSFREVLLARLEYRMVV